MATKNCHRHRRNDGDFEGSGGECAVYYYKDVDDEGGCQTSSHNNSNGIISPITTVPFRHRSVDDYHRPYYPLNWYYMRKVETQKGMICCRRRIIHFALVVLVPLFLVIFVLLVSARLPQPTTSIRRGEKEKENHSLLLERQEKKISTRSGDGIGPPPLMLTQQQRKREPQRRRQEEIKGNIEEETTILLSREDDGAATKTYDHSFDQQIQEYILTNYSKSAYPWEYWWDLQKNETQQEEQQDGSFQQQQRVGVPVEMNINFFKVFEIDVASSTADIVVWVKLRWKDPRLVWDPSRFGFVDETFMWIESGSSGNEASQIWIPDIYLWNQQEPMSNTLSDTYAMVWSNGTVIWSRPGRIKVTCKFDGLSKFPYDTLGCKMEFSSWSKPIDFVNLKKYDGKGYSKKISETSGESYNEYTLKDVGCSYKVMDDWSHPWPVLVYHMGFDRAHEPYVRGYIVSQCLLTLCSISSMWIPPHIGERMGLTITAVLSGIALELVVAQSLPKSKKISWFSIFAYGNTVLGIFLVLQAAVVIYFYHHTGNTLRPVYVRNFVSWWHTRQQYSSFRENNSNKTKINSNNKDAARPHQQHDYKEEREREEAKLNARNSDDQEHAPSATHKLTSNKKLVSSDNLGSDGGGTTIIQKYKYDKKNVLLNGNGNGVSSFSFSSSPAVPALRAVTFCGNVSADSFGATEEEEEQTSAPFLSVEKSLSGKKYKNDMMSSAELIILENEAAETFPRSIPGNEQEDRGGSNPQQYTLSATSLSKSEERVQEVKRLRKRNRRATGKKSELFHEWNTVTTPDIVAKMDYNAGKLDATEFYEETAERNNNKRWQKVSSRIDEYSRLIIPIVYAVFLIGMFVSTKERELDNENL